VNDKRIAARRETNLDRKIGLTIRRSRLWTGAVSKSCRKVAKVASAEDTRGSPARGYAFSSSVPEIF